MNYSFEDYEWSTTEDDGDSYKIVVTPIEGGRVGNMRVALKRWIPTKVTNVLEATWETEDAFDLILAPRVYLGYMSRPCEVNPSLWDFFKDYGIKDQWSDEETAGSQVEIAGRLCYDSWNRRNVSNIDYVHSLIASGHGSVLEHVSWSFIITGISRTCLVDITRHRVGASFSVLSQRFVDQSKYGFIVPEAVLRNDKLRAQHFQSIFYARKLYRETIEELTKSNEFVIADDPRGRRRRKAIHEDARTVLPPSAEVRLMLTMNGRSLRHFLALRGKDDVSKEVRALAVEVHHTVCLTTSSLFADFVALPEDELGGHVLSTPYPKP